MQTVPQPLRRKSVVKPADSRFVTLFSDASNMSDITMSDGHKGLLPKSTKLYEVGIDNLTLSMNGLSMVTPSPTEPVILEILALRTFNGQQAGVPNNPIAGWPAFPTDFRLGAPLGAPIDFQLLDTTVIDSMSDFMVRLNKIASKVSDVINGGFTTGDHWEFRDVDQFVSNFKHLSFELHNSGRLDVQGSRTFWSYFCIHVPNPVYRAILFGNHFNASLDQRIISVNPLTGALLDDDARIHIELDITVPAAPVERGFTFTWAAVDVNLDAAFETQVSNNPQDEDSELYGSLIMAYIMGGNLYASMDGRVCIEVGTSLPLTHSALIEDNKEKPDYSLGRFMFNPALRVNYSIADRESHEVHGPSTYELMNSDKRVLYHRLMPQEKVSVLRIQMYIRRRVYDVAKDMWSMRVTPLPTVPTDWWHCRLHFRELHETAISQKQSPYQ